MDKFHIANRRSFNPYIALNLAGDYGVLDDLIDCLLAAIDDVFPGQSSEFKAMYDGEESLEQQVKFREFCADFMWYVGHDSSFMQNYLLRTQKALTVGPFEDISESQIEDLILVCIDESYFPEMGHLAHYQANSTVERFYLEMGFMTLAPFFLFSWQPISQWREISYVERVLRDLLFRDDPLEIDQICQRLMQRGIRCTKQFVEFILVNSADLLRLRLDEDRWGADLSEEIFGHFELAAATIDRSQYLRITGGRVFAHGVEPTDVSFEIIDTHLRDFFGHWKEGRFIDLVDWDEVAIKLWLHRKSIGGTVQGLNTVLHSEIVKFLVKRNSAAKLSDFCRYFGVLDLPIYAERLPPGRILAYAPSPRFLKREATFYVLREWVEDKDNKRGRIRRQRIVTPLHEKSYSVSEKIVLSCCSNDRVLGVHGVCSAEIFALKLAQNLPDTPTEIYYLNKITEFVSSILDREYTGLGKGLFVDSRFEEIVDSELNPTRNRRKILNFLLGYPDNVRVALQDISSDEYAIFERFL